MTIVPYQKKKKTKQNKKTPVLPKLLRGKLFQLNHYYAGDDSSLK